MIVLTILKIIGIVLLCVIALAILLLLLILFVPIDYCVKVKGDGEVLDANGGVKWLFGAVGAKAWLEKKEVFYKIKVFGFSVKKGKVGEKKENIDGKEKDKNKKITDIEKKVKAGDKADTAKTVSCALNSNKAEISSEGYAEYNPVNNTGNIQEDNIADKEEHNLKKYTENVPDNNSAGEADKKIEVKIFEIEQERKRKEAESLKQAESEKTQAEKEEKKAGKEAKKEEKAVKKAEKKQKFKERLEKAKNIKTKAEQIKRALDTKTGQRAKALVKSELFRLLGYIKPTLIKGSLVIGTEDPAKTAEIYGAVSQITYLISDGRLVAEPDFDRKIIQPDVVVKGRIFLFRIAAAALKIILNKDVSRLWKEIRRITNG